MIGESDGGQGQGVRKRTVWPNSGADWRGGMTVGDDRASVRTA